VFLKLRFSANQVSYFSVLVALLAAVSMMTGNRLLIIVGALLFNVWAVLDCVDGNVARARGQANEYGSFVDALSGYIATALVILSIGVAAEYQKPVELAILNRVNYMLVGGIILVSRLTMGLIYLRFREVSGSDPLGPGSSGRRLAANIDITGLMMPAVLVGAILDLLPLIALFYCAYYGLVFVVLTVRIILEIEKRVEEGNAMRQFDNVDDRREEEYRS
jgi:phosphatidylglycerophosphate synthase